MHDELMPSRKVAAYWVEHVLRHGGPKHPQSKDMPFYQVYLLDFWLFLFVSLVFTMFASYKFGALILRRLTRSKLKTH
jgi:glucuronosyltransferase